MWGLRDRAAAPTCDTRREMLSLTTDELLSTTRAVRRRLDLERPVEREVLEDCLRLGQQAPVAAYRENWHFVVVTDAEKRAALGELWRSFGAKYLGGYRPEPEASRGPQAQRLLESVWHLVDHIGDVPVHVIPCIEGRTDGAAVPVQASRFGTILPAVWSFMLAARSRGLGTCWTTFHLAYEREAADLLGIPYDDVMQVALIPVAYTKGTDFRPGRRKPLDRVVHWDGWQETGSPDAVGA
jgi:nitroreductase